MDWSVLTDPGANLSDDARAALVELGLDGRTKKCARCGHSQVFETYPEQESDGKWLE